MSETSASTAASEERFGDYLLLEKIAQGGMAELFLAKRRGVEGFEKTVAIKRILPELSWHREFVSMFINEAKIAARLSHPNIVQIFDFGKVDSYYFIAMEYVHGENLRTILKRAEERQVPLMQDLAALITARACAGLDHAHRKTDESGKPLRIIHRDVSPQNVLVSYDGEVKVVDFGIAKAVAENPEATRGVLKGKLAYLSPEQVAGKNLDARSDVFAIGTVLYELITGRKLFDMKDPAEILDSITRIDAAAVAKSLPNASKSLREVLRRSLARDPDERYASAGAMQQALEEYLRERDEVSGTMQLTSYMRLLFDERIGEHTFEDLRSQLLARSGAGPSRGPSPRVLAAAGGALAALLALWVAAPSLRGSAAPAAESRAESEAESPEPARPASDEPGAEVAAEAASPAAGDLQAAAAALAANRPGEAVAAYERAFAAAPAERGAHAEPYAAALVEDGKTVFESDSDAAAERLEKAIAADPDNFDARFLLAKVYTRKSDPEAAAKQYLEAVRIRPDSADAQFNLGFVYFSMKEYDRAREQYEKVLELKPAYLADVFYNLAACYEQMRRKADAIETLREGVAAVPSSELLRSRLKQLGG